MAYRSGIGLFCWGLAASFPPPLPRLYLNFITKIRIYFAGGLQQQHQRPSYPQSLSPSAQRNLEITRVRGEQDLGPMFLGEIPAAGPSPGKFPTPNPRLIINPWDTQLINPAGLKPIPTNSSVGAPFLEDLVPIFTSNETNVYPVSDVQLFPNNLPNTPSKNESWPNEDLRMTLLAKKQSKESAAKTTSSTSLLEPKYPQPPPTFLPEIFDLPPPPIAGSGQGMNPFFFFKLECYAMH